MKKEKAITLISLAITIIVLIILASVSIYLSLGNNGIFTRAKEAKEVTNKQQATDIINLKITTAQMNKYAEKQEMPTLKELSEVLKDDNEIQYVTETSKVAVVEYDVPSTNPTSIYTKLNKYPYEFEINDKLQLASINGVKVATVNNSSNDYSLEETKTNETWMGKTIYRKVIYIEQLPNATAKEYNHGIQNIETIWIDMGNSFIDWNSTGAYSPIPYVHISSIVSQISLSVNKNCIRINTGNANRSSDKSYITLKYTKTTDNVN